MYWKTDEFKLDTTVNNDFNKINIQSVTIQKFSKKTIGSY